MNSDEMTTALKAARQTIQATDNMIGDLAYLVAGRLRSGNVSSHALRRLKRELQDFDSRSGTWRT